MTPATAPRRDIAVFLVLAVLFLAAYAAIAWHARVHDVTDSALYRQIARQPLGLMTLFENLRPPLYPLLIRFCAGNGRAIATVQFLAYAASWLLFARTLFVRSPLPAGTVVAALALYYALYPDFAGWNHVIMTESLSLSLLVATIACLVRLLDGGGRANLVAIVALCWANAMLRDFNEFIAPSLILPLGVLLLRRRISAADWIAASLALVLCYAAMTWSSDHVLNLPMEARWVFPMLNDIGQRILPNENAVRFFAAHGMPVTPALRAMTGKLSFESGGAFYASPALAGFRDWLVAHAKPTYMAYLLSHPGYTISSVLGDPWEVFYTGPFLLRPYLDPGYAVDAVPRVPFWIVYAVGGIGPLALIGVGIWRRNAALLTRALFCAALFAIIPPLAVIVYHADTMEVTRHAVSIPLLAVLEALVVLSTFQARQRFLF